jgi:peptidylprolyl isomerase
MTEASSGNTVRIHYTGRLTDGTEFDTSAGSEPLEFELGAGQIISGLDEAVTGMKVGETSTVTVPADKAYGPHHPEAVSAVPRENIPEGIALEPGLRLQAQREDGTALALTVVEIGEDRVTLDANHPLAGRDLVFELELVEVL